MDWQHWTDDVEGDDDRGHGSGCGPAGSRRGSQPWHAWFGPGFAAAGRPAGPPPWVAGLLGLGAQPQPGPKVRRGDVRSAILSVLATAEENGEPVNGYQVIQQIGERTGDQWRPSPGSVYPTIQQLEDEGLVETDTGHGRRALRLTDAGRDHVREAAEELDHVWAPFEDRRTGTDPNGAVAEVGQVMSAVWQIVSQGSEAQKKALVRELTEMRRRLYGILADGPEKSR